MIRQRPDGSYYCDGRDCGFPLSWMPPDPEDASMPDTGEWVCLDCNASMYAAAPNTQQDDHCWLNALGHDVRIVEMRGLREIRVLTRSQVKWIIDLSDVPWDAYNSKARQLLFFNYGLPA